MNQNDRERWLAERRTGLGGSDIAAVLGLSPWRAPWDVQAEKRGETLGRDESSAMRRGRLLEDSVARWYAEETGADVFAPSTLLFRGPEPWMLASPDRFVGTAEGARWILECKTARSQEGWGEDGSDATGSGASAIVPVSYALQCLWYMEVLGFDRCDVACYITVADDWRRYTLRRDADFGKKLVVRCREWWQRYVVEGEPLPVSGSDDAHDWLGRTFPAERAPLRAATAEEEALVAELVAAREAVRAAEARKSTAETQVKAAIGEAEGLRAPAARVTWKAQTSRRVDLDALRADWSEAAAACTRETTMRVLRVGK